MSSTEKLKPLTVFYSYAYHSRRDTSLKRDLEKHLSTLRQQGQIKGWSADDISPGADQKQETTRNLNRAYLILVLISPDYMHSDQHYKEMQLALERRKANKSCILFVLLRPTELEETECSEYAAYFYPSYDKPVTSYANRDEAFNLIAQGVRGVVQEYREREEALKAGQIVSRSTLPPNSRQSTPIISPTSTTITTKGNNTGKKRSIKPGSQVQAQIAEPTFPKAAWDKKRLPKSQTIPTVNTSQASRSLTSRDISKFWGKFFSSKEFGRCSSRKGNSDLLFFLFIMLDIVFPTIWLGDALTILNLPWFVTIVILLLLFFWGVYNIFLPVAIFLSFLFGGAWALIANHYQGWSGTLLLITIVVVWISNFFLFKSHKKPGIFTLH